MKLKLIILTIPILYSSNAFLAREYLPCQNTHIESCSIACEAMYNNTIDYPNSNGNGRQIAAINCVTAVTSSKKMIRP